MTDAGAYDSQETKAPNKHDYGSYTSPIFARSYLEKVYSKHVTVAQDRDQVADQDGEKSLGPHYNNRLLSWLHQEFSSDRKYLLGGGRLLDIGSGPSIIGAISASRVFDEIIMTDVSEHCLDEITRWQRGDPDAFDWSPITEFVADLEGNDTRRADVEDRVKKSIKRTVQLDLDDEALLAEGFPPVDCITAILAFTSASKDAAAFASHLQKVVSYLKPGGTMLLGMMSNPSDYIVSGKLYRGIKIQMDAMLQCISDAGLSNITFSGYPVPQRFQNQSDTYYVFISAKKVP